MIKIAARSLGLLLLLLVASASDGAWRFRIAGVQAGCGQIGSSRSMSGFQLGVCAAPGASRASRSPARYVIHVGAFRSPVVRRSAAELWALYD